jgi:copper oxidase (laccase) domain-containing protein
MLFDLPGYSLQRLYQAGVGHAEWTRHCTYRDPERFFSFRRTTHAGEADYGRLISVIRL